jgi:uncharacterized protein with HEPN domain
MRDHAREAVNLLRGKTREGLESDRILGLAVVRLLEILGEAANRVPAQERSRLPQIPWREIISLRNRLIHAYRQRGFRRRLGDCFRGSTGFG